jgi:uncharacterized protein (DUF952 family)
MSSFIYKIVPQSLWREAERAGTFTAAQVRETASKHFAGQGDLLLVAVEGAALGDALRWEPSRGGALFPHLYAALPVDAALWVRPLPLGPDGQHLFPELETA